MGIAGSIVVFIIIWWMVLFMVLPWGVTSQKEAGDITPGTAHEAPVKPMLLKKMLLTTGIAIILWGVAFYLISSGIINLGEIPTK